MPLSKPHNFLTVGQRSHDLVKNSCRDHEPFRTVEQRHAADSIVITFDTQLGFCTGERICRTLETPGILQRQPPRTRMLPKFTFFTMDVSRKTTSRTFSAASLVLLLLFSISKCNACQPGEAEMTESKFYRSQIVIQATVSTRQDRDVVVRVERTVKPADGSGVDSETITLNGFGTEDPCFWEATDLSDNTAYFFFLRGLDEAGYYPIVGNPVEATKKERKLVRKFMQDGAAPTFARELKDKTYLPGGRATVSCSASGYPSPKLTMMKDNVTLSKGAIRGISYKSGKGGIKLKLKNLQKAVHEGVYACIADNGVHPQIMTSATIEICALSCDHGELNEKNCECQCEGGWDGFTCNIPLLVANSSIPCNLDCGEHGRVLSDECKCSCDDNYVGETCGIMCDKTCGDHGTLDHDTCSCRCDDGYYGDACLSEFDLSSGDGGGITAGTADQLCHNNSYCLNGGTCHSVEDPKTRELLSLCSCPRTFMGDRCEIPKCNLDCGLHGSLHEEECRCVCEPDYRGTYCQVLVDDHTEPCGPEYEHYCMNGGTCIHLKGIMRPSCRCPILYYGDRCDLLEPELDCGCMNGGRCQYNPRLEAYMCICLKKFTGERCQFKSLPPSRPNANTKENSRKMIITICVIFLAMLIVIGLVVVIYIRNRTAREKERREKLEEMIQDQRTGMRLQAPLQFTGAGGTCPADDIEMTSFHRNSNQMPDVRMESEQQLGATMPGDRSQGQGSLPRSHNDSMNRLPDRSSQTSIHSQGSQGEGRGSAHIKGGKNGYEAVPTQEDPTGKQGVQPKNDSDTSLEGPGDPDTLPLKHPRASSDLGSESEESEGEGDLVDVPNPQIQALQNHLGGSDHDSGDYTWDEHSSPGLRITSPYAHDSSPLHQPRGRGRLDGVDGSRSPDRIHIHENPLENPGSKTDAMNNVMSGSPKDAYYGDRLKDVVEGSPPSAV